MAQKKTCSQIEEIINVSNQKIIHIERYLDVLGEMKILAINANRSRSPWNSQIICKVPTA
jgi:hypothetical protein